MANDIGILILEKQHFAQVFICCLPFLIITKGRVLGGMGAKPPEADDILTFETSNFSPFHASCPPLLTSTEVDPLGIG